MTTMLTCKACGYIGFDVQSRIVRNPDPHPVQYTSLGHPVMEEYRREARCIDREACEDRQEAKGEIA